MDTRSTVRHFRKAKYNVALSIVGVLLPLAVLEGIWTLTVHQAVDSHGSNVVDFSEPLVQGRHLLQTQTDTVNCTPRAIHEFPDDFMTQEQRKHGGVVFHIFVSLYLFVAIAIACDDFFVPALEKICEVLKIQPDVAGATFMAAGSSAPEFFAAVIGIFFAKSDIGLSTIVGSALFNLLLVNAVCGLFAGMVIYLTWWPVIRDCSYYTFSVIILIIVMYDEVVHWYESLVMVLLYVLYVAMMYFNRPFGNYLMNKITCCHNNREDTSAESPETDSKRPLLEDTSMDRDDVRQERNKVSGSGQYGSIHESPKEISSNLVNNSFTLDASHEAASPLTRSQLTASMSSDVTVASGRETHESPLTRPPGCWRGFLWAIMLPASVVMTITTPDFRRGGCWSRLYVLTFLVSIIWIAVLSYLLVWMVTISGDTLGIPDTVMGLTLLAIGTSIPDAIASLLVAKDGYGDMAVSNSVGSNVFDILLCLGLPWLIQTGMISPNSEIQITSRGLTYSTITLLGTIVFLVLGLMVNKWRLDKRFGTACLVVYILVVAMSCLNELNVFGYVNPPMCPW